MTNRDHRAYLDNDTTFLGILLGIVIGSLYALLHIKQTGKTTRKDLIQFGAGTLELDIDSSLDDAKQQARQRMQPTD